MILIVDLNWKKDSLAYSEFVLPILKVIQPLEACEVKHYLEFDSSEISKYSRIILSGTTLKDFSFLEHPERFKWIKTCDKPLLGICAGMQTIVQEYGEALTVCFQVGMTEINTVKENPLFSGTFQAYALHTYSIKVNKIFDTLAESKGCIEAIKHKQRPIYGVLFHPEVRNKEVLQKFLRL